MLGRGVEYLGGLERLELALVVVPTVIHEVEAAIARPPKIAPPRINVRLFEVTIRVAPNIGLLLGRDTDGRCGAMGPERNVYIRMSLHTCLR